MKLNHRLTTAILSLVLLASSGCSYLESLMHPKSTTLSKAEIKRMIKESEKDLPQRLDENFTLTKITMDYGGTLNGWYTVSDEITAEFRKIGSVKIEEAMRENIAKLDLESCDVPSQLVQLFKQDDFAIQYILEDKYGSPIASVVVSKETMEGDERVGRSQQNPFAIRNVSQQGDK